MRMAVDLSTNRQGPLSHTFNLPDSTLASHYATTLLHELGALTESLLAPAASDAAIDWANSGLMVLTGYPEGPPLQGPGAIPSCARGALTALRMVAGDELLAGTDGAGLLSERAASLNFTRRGATSPNGSCRLMKAADAYIALNLARKSDLELMHVWLKCEGPVSGWEEIARRVSHYPAVTLVEFGRLMGLPVSLAVAPGSQVPPWYTVTNESQPSDQPSSGQPLVIDLSSLWAGPLCGHLLSCCGARVIKVESAGRPDGARAGAPAFFDLLNSGKTSVVLDLAQSTGQQQLRQLIEHADIVIESSRPRALRQMGIDAEQLVATQPGLVWTSITGYGRDEPMANWVAFGDDATVAAGVAMATADPPLFCGDALADPLTGLHAALVSYAHFRAGWGGVLDLSLCNVVAHCLGFAPHQPRGSVTREDGEWFLIVDDREILIEPPKQRPVSAKAAALGADTGRVLNEFNIPC